MPTLTMSTRTSSGPALALDGWALALSPTSTFKREFCHLSRFLNFENYFQLPNSDSNHLRYPDPGVVYTATIDWAEDQASHVFEQTTNFFENNQDPDAFPALLYYYKDPQEPNAVVPLRERQFVFQLNAVYFGGNETILNSTFGSFYEGASSIAIQEWTLKSLDQYLLTNYPCQYHPSSFTDPYF